MAPSPEGPGGDAPSVWAVVVAAGSGARFGGTKQFAGLAGRPVVERSVEACRSVADGVVVVLPADQLPTRPSGPTWWWPAAPPARPRSAVASPPCRGRGGGGTRRRPPAGRRRPLFASVVAAVAGGPADGAVCALPLADTVKRLGPDGTVAETVPRADLVAVQTPQGFRAEVLRRAHAGGSEATDDAALVEALGATVRVVPGSPDNIKITTPADLAYAEHLLGG